MPIVYKDGRKFEKWRKALGDGTYGDPHIPYTKLDGTLEADIAAIKDSVDDPVEVSTNVGRFAEEQRLTDAYRAAHPEEFDEEE